MAIYIHLLIQFSQTSNSNHFCSGININFSINLCAISNTQVDSLTLTNEKYRPYKVKSNLLLLLIY